MNTFLNAYTLTYFPCLPSLQTYLHRSVSLRYWAPGADPGLGRWDSTHIIVCHPPVSPCKHMYVYIYIRHSYITAQYLYTCNANIHTYVYNTIHMYICVYTCILEYTYIYTYINALVIHKYIVHTYISWMHIHELIHIDTCLHA